MANIYDLADTWNDDQVTWTAIKMDVDLSGGYAAASKLLDLQVASASKFSVDPDGIVSIQDGGYLSPAIQFTDSPTTGIYSQTSNGLAISAGGTQVLSAKSDFVNVNIGVLRLTNDVWLQVDGAHQLALRKDLNPQSLSIYNTYTSSSVYERLRMYWDTNLAYISAEHQGGSHRSLIVRSHGSNVFRTFEDKVLFYRTVSAFGDVDLGLESEPFRDLHLGGQAFIGGQTVTTDTPAITVTQTWNDALVAFNAIDIDITDTASDQYSNFLVMKYGGSNQITFRKNGTISATNFWTTQARLNSGENRFTNYIGMAVNIGSGSDVKLFRDDVAQLALRDGVTPHSLAIYETYTDASNYSRLRTYFDSNDGLFLIKSEALGTGTTRRIRTSIGANYTQLESGAYTVNAVLRPTTDGVWDLGSSARRWKDFYFSGRSFIPDGTAAAPAISFANDPNTGVFKPGVYEIRFAVNGIGRVSISQSSNSLHAINGISLGSNSVPSNADIFLYRDAANQLAIRNGLEPQSFALYNTYTDGSNYERLRMYWDSSIARIAAEHQGGTQRDIHIQARNIVLRPTDIAGNPANGWWVKPTGNLLPQGDNIESLGEATFRINKAFIQTFSGLISSAGAPTTTELPADKDWAIHKNTSSDLLTLAYNDGGSVSALPIKIDELSSAVLTNTTSGLTASVGTQQFVFSFDSSSISIIRSGSPRVRSATDLILQSFNGAVSMALRTNEIVAANPFAFGSTFTTPDVYLYRDDANQLALRNGINAQSFAVYGTYTSGTVYERLRASYDSSGRFVIGSEAGSGGGTLRSLRMYQGDPTGSNYIDIRSTTIILRASGAALSLDDDNKSFGPVVGSIALGTDTNPWTELRLKERGSDPSDPSEGNCVLWQSNGTGTGDDGDILIKVTAGGSTTTGKIWHSGIQDELSSAVRKDEQNTDEFNIISSGGTASFRIQSNGRVTTTESISVGTNLDGGGQDMSIDGIYGIRLDPDLMVSWGTSGYTSNPDVRLYRDDANQLAIRNGLNAQSFAVYNTYTSSSVYERLRIYWGTTTAYIAAERDGAGDKDITFQRAGADKLVIAGVVRPPTNNTESFGNGTFRWKQVFSNTFSGLISSAGAPTTTELPTDKDWAIHKNTSSSLLTLAYNDGGSVSALPLKLDDLSSAILDTPTLTGTSVIDFGAASLTISNAGWPRITSSAQLYLGGSGGSTVLVRQDRFTILPTRSLAFASSGVTEDLFVVQDAANQLALRNGLDQQSFAIYNTYTSSSVYERLRIYTLGPSGYAIESETQGGSFRKIRIQGPEVELQTGSRMLRLQADGIRVVGDLYAFTTATDLGLPTSPWGNIYLHPSSSITPNANGDLCIEATNDTTLTFKYKGSDGTVRSGTVTLA